MSHSENALRVLKLSDVVENQAIINIGTAGHVAQGKSTVVRCITGQATQAFKAEKERNITIRLGYANCKIFLNPDTNKVFAFPEDTKKAYDPVTDEPLKQLYQVSFVDCPGHQAYIATMISGSYIMDHVLVVVAANESIPQPQTHEHLVALEYSGIPKTEMCYLLNKLDIVPPKKIPEIKDTLETYLDSNFGEHEGEGEDGRKVIPISAATGDNMDAVITHIAEQVQGRMAKTIEQAQQPLEMYIVRSYNINRPNTPIAQLEGAVVGGSILRGVLSVGDLIEIRPGVINMKDGKRVVQPLIAKVTSLKSGKNDVEAAIPGGLVGVNLSLYAGLSGGDSLKGQVLTHVGKGDPIYNVLTGKFRGASSLSAQATQLLAKVVTGSQLSVVVNGIMNVKGKVTRISSKLSKKTGEVKGSISIALDKPVVLNIDSTNCVAIEIDGHLVAGLNVTEANCTMPVIDTIPETYQGWEPEKYSIVNDLPEYKASDTSDFTTLAGKIKHIGKAVKTEVIKPGLNIVNLSTFITGMDRFVASLTPDDAKVDHALDMNKIVVSHIERSFPNCKPRYNGEGVLVLTGRWNQKQFDGFLSAFIKNILRCPSCKSDVSVIAKHPKTKLISRNCTVCGSVTYLDKC